MSDLSRFAALAARNGAVAPVSPPYHRGDTGRTSGNNSFNQLVKKSVSPVSPVAPRNSDPLHEADLKAAFEERAAIMEFDGGLSRQVAEGLAWAEVFGSRSRPAKTPGNS